MEKTVEIQTLAPAKDSTKALAPGQSDNLSEISKLIPKSRKDKAAAAQVLKLLDQNGTLRKFGDLFDVAALTESSLIKALLGDEDALGVAILERRQEEMRATVAGPLATPLETLLAEQIAMCRFHLYLCEAQVIQNQNKWTVGQGAYQQKRLDRAHHRYLSAIKMLAQVRRLQLPNVQPLQVNIGAHVNAAQLNAAQVNGG